MVLKSISLNDEVEVILTDFGRQILDNYRTKMEQEIKLSLESSFLNCDENGKYLTQMWNLMEVFGNHMYSGIQIFYQNKIYYRKT
jgi:hypothetical protein